MRLGIVTQYYPPEIGAPQARLSDLARRFVAHGHQVHVLTALPNYPLGRIHDGYRGIWRREIREGARVSRTWIYPSQRLGLLPRMGNYLSFAVSALFPGLALLPGKLDYLLTESPPLFLGPTGWMLARLKGARWIFNVSDLWPESAVRMGIVSDGIALRMARWLESWCYRRAWLVTGQSRGILEDIGRRYPQVRTHLLTNGVDPEIFHPEASGAVERSDLGWAQDETVGVYVGLHGAAQGLDQILRALASLEGAVKLGIHFYGDGPEKRGLVALAGELGLKNVVFHDPVAWSEVPGILANADFVLACLGGDIPGAVPSKIYEAMGVGRPLLVVASSEPAAIVEQAGAGLAVPPGDTSRLVSALRRMATDPELRVRLGEAGRHAAKTLYDRRKIAAEFLELLERELVN